MVKQLFFFMWLGLAQCAAAQQVAADSLGGNDGAAIALHVFHEAAGKQSLLYNGRVHVGYDPSMTGSAYYLSVEAQAGTVEYEGIRFSDVPIWYDEVKDKVVVQYFNKIGSFELTNERVSRFWIGSHAFVRLDKDNENTPAPGFYEVLCSGNLTILARRKKQVLEFIENMEVKRKIEIRESFYAKKEGVYHAVNSERQLLSVVKDKKSQVQQYLKNNKLKMRRDPDTVLAKAAVFYNQIIN